MDNQDNSYFYKRVGNLSYSISKVSPQVFYMSHLSRALSVAFHQRLICLYFFLILTTTCNSELLNEYHSLILYNRQFTSGQMNKD